jgi:hypothetical protein
MRRREGLPFVSPLFTQVRRTGILGSSLPASNSKQQQKYGHLAYRHTVLAPRYLTH